MRLEIVQLDPTTTRLELEGRMDAPGCERIETAFTAAASASGAHMLVDLRKVEFVGSLGVRLLISSARVIQRRGRKMVIFGAQAQPMDVFETVALPDLIPIVVDQDEALALVAAG